MNYISKLVNQYLTSRHTPETEEKVQQWLVDDEHAEEKDVALREFWDNTATADTVRTREALAKAKRNLGMVEPRGRTIPLRRKLLRVAAVLLPLLILAGGYWYVNRPIPVIEVTTAYGQRKQITLPDGSQVWLNAGSRLNYPERFTKTRTMQLSGEAYFSATKNPSKPFVVETEYLSVRALGTEFNVVAYPDDTETTTSLVSGKIQVDIPNGQSYLLSPNQELSFARHVTEPKVERVAAADIIAKRDGSLIFDNATLEEMLRSMERHYGIVAYVQNTIHSDDRYTVRFVNGETLEQAINVLEDVIGTSISVTTKKDGHDK